MENQNLKAEAGKPFLEIKNLRVHYETNDGVVEAVNGIDMELRHGEVYGLVGETGAGKTSVALTIMGLLPFPPSRIVSGEILLEGEDLLKKTNEQMRKIRGKRISMIFQDPMTALNPVQKVGKQIAECIALHEPDKSKKNIEGEAGRMLEMVGIPAERFNDYPHQFSGGMKQRVVIAMALSCYPELIIADEPTTALDVTIQAQVLALMKQLQEQSGTSMLVITHDFGVVAEMCDKCAVMYAGEIVESGSVEDFFENPQHPYTIGLFESLPSVGVGGRLKPIPGVMADPMDLPSCCTFAERCPHASDECRAGDPELTEVAPGHFVKCFRVGSPAKKGD